MLVANIIFEILRVTIERLSSNLADSSGQFFMTQAGLIKQLQIEPITQQILYPRNLFLLPRAIQKQSSKYTTKTSCCYLTLLFTKLAIYVPIQTNVLVI